MSSIYLTCLIFSWPSEGISCLKHSLREVTKIQRRFLHKYVDLSSLECQ